MGSRFFSVFIIQMVLISSPLYGQETWKIASLNWEPYSSAQMSTQGNSIQKLRALLKQENITLLVDYYPWKRAQKVAREKEYVGYFPAWPEEVHDGFTASPVIDWSWIGILKLSDKILDYQTLDELFRHHRVGLVSSYVYPEEIAGAARKAPDNVVYAPNEMSLLKMLLVGRQDCAITDPFVMTYLAEKDGIGEIETAQILMKKALVLAFRNDEENQHRIRLLRKLLEESRL